MNDLIRNILVMSVSGNVLSLILFAVKFFLKGFLPRTTQYYLWLVVLAALLVPVRGITIPRAIVSETVTRYVISPEEEMDRFSGFGMSGDPIVAELQSPISTQVIIFMLIYPLPVIFILLWHVVKYFAVRKKTKASDELPYLRKGGIIIKCLALLAAAIHWFNPVVWLVRCEINRVCDERSDSTRRQSRSEIAVSTFCVAAAIAVVVLFGAGSGAENVLPEFEAIVSNETGYSHSLNFRRGDVLYSPYIADGMLQTAESVSHAAEIGFAVDKNGGRYKIFNRSSGSGGYTSEEFIVVQDDGFMNPPVIYAAAAEKTVDDTIPQADVPEKAPGDAAFSLESAMTEAIISEFP